MAKHVAECAKERSVADGTAKRRRATAAAGVQRAYHRRLLFEK